MYICPNCKQTFDNPTNFCPSCGSAVVEATPVAEPTPIVEPTPVVEATPGPSLGKVIAGMAIAIAGAIFAIVGFIYTAVAMIVEGMFAFVFALVYMFFSLPLALVGLIISKNCANAGSTSKMCGIGKTLGIIGVILSGLMFLLGFIALIG